MPLGRPRLVDRAVLRARASTRRPTTRRRASATPARAAASNTRAAALDVDRVRDALVARRLDEPGEVHDGVGAAQRRGRGRPRDVARRPSSTLSIDERRAGGARPRRSASTCGSADEAADEARPVVAGGSDDDDAHPLLQLPLMWDFSTEPEFQAHLDWMRDVRARGDLAARDARPRLRPAHARDGAAAGGGQGARPVGGAPRPRARRPGLRPGQARPHARDPRHDADRAVRVRQPGAGLGQLGDPRAGRHRRSRRSAGCTRCWPATCTRRSR